VSATSSGNFVTPMMLGVVTGSFTSGQLLSRAGGRYRIQGAVGVIIMAVGMWLLSRMNVDTTSGTAVRNMIITGFGLGITMPLYTIAVQNAVPYKVLGVATSTATFFRSIGGSVGLAIFGSILNNRFAAEMSGRIPLDFANAVPPQQLDILMHNPQVLMNPEAQVQLQNTVDKLGNQGGTLLHQVMQALRESLALSIAHVFMYAMIIVGLAFIVNLFIKEIPLRSHHGPDTSHLEKKVE
jgi:hypothetical protein